ncbi:hypothetical protein [Paraburkholderia sp. HD33-4]|uniref:hypothetical protein n=1 Tax=Paraburkholderia sp. HD33-4 TaxID=2883242 RepID=UPI001F423E0F|nr:hypothetical protein [Paraburkholderia sp. HD33-4]
MRISSGSKLTFRSHGTSMQIGLIQDQVACVEWPMRPPKTSAFSCSAWSRERLIYTTDFFKSSTLRNSKTHLASPGSANSSAIAAGYPRHASGNRCDDDTPRVIYRPIGQRGVPPARHSCEQSLTLRPLCTALRFHDRGLTTSRGPSESALPLAPSRGSRDASEPATERIGHAIDENASGPISRT